ncbi:uncharacterized protein LOC111553510 [Piliocolobus tephrosceles]|uniref:uncharacterized protein LOC111553510 n=1 Tax=Piliocolobus tephrosceles TaxID=591936 RepID=UPI000C29C4B3|nr:uncharacterized protein LOC111553510 [Piliocolobus tephrosceles]
MEYLTWGALKGRVSGIQEKRRHVHRLESLHRYNREPRGPSRLKQRGKHGSLNCSLENPKALLIAEKPCLSFLFSETRVDKNGATCRDVGLRDEPDHGSRALAPRVWGACLLLLQRLQATGPELLDHGSDASSTWKSHASALPSTPPTMTQCPACPGNLMDLFTCLKGSPRSQGKIVSQEKCFCVLSLRRPPEMSCPAGSPGTASRQPDHPATAVPLCKGPGPRAQQESEKLCSHRPGLEGKELGECFRLILVSKESCTNCPQETRWRVLPGMCVHSCHSWRKQALSLALQSDEKEALVMLDLKTCLPEGPSEYFCINNRI